MHLKGIDKLREKLPAYLGRRIGLLPLRGLIAAVIAYSILIFLDILPRLLIDIPFLDLVEPFMPFIGSLFVGAMILWLLAGVWTKRDTMKAKYGDIAYQKMIPRGVTGVALLPAVIFHAFTSIRSLPGEPVNDITTLWAQPLLPLIGVPTLVDLILRISLSLVFIVTGMLLVRSAIFTFGIDYMMVVYLYFPEESEIQEHAIYSVLRHPTYLTVVLFGIGAMFFRLSVYSIGICIIIYLVIRLHTRREEEELIERFGDGFRDYMSRVPALLIRPQQLRAFFKFILNKRE